jgi:hypothetical protein
MSDSEKLIPSPPVVRDQLARTVKEMRLLRSLLRVAVRAAEQRHHPEPVHQPILGNSGSEVES